AAAGPLGPGDDPDEALVLRLARCEGAEVVLAEQEVRGLVEPPLVERARQPPAPPQLEGRRRAAAEDAVAVAARAREAAGVEAGRDLRDGDDRDVVREQRVHRLGGALGRRAALDRDARDLRERVDAGVRPARHRELRPAREDAVECGPERALDGPEPRLRGPAVEAGAVVLER